MRLTPRTAALAALLLTLLLPAHAADIIVHAGHLIDGISDAPRAEVSILIRDGRIVSVTPGYTTPPGAQPNAQILDLSHDTVLPGLIDTHVHLTFSLSDGPLSTQLTRNSAFDRLISASVNARTTLLAGFTSVRDLHGYTPAVVALKKGIASGKIEGPRLWVAGGMLGPTGGHEDYRNGFSSDLTARLDDPEWTEGVIDSPEAAVRKVRERRLAGVDLIKITPSGGVSSDGDDPNAQLMTDAEIKAVVETAHALNMRVAAHAHGRIAIEHASQLGVDSIEHGTFANAGTYQIMKANNTWLVPTLLAGDFEYQIALKHPELLGASSREKILAEAPIVIQNFTNAYKAGVRIAFGTDTGVSPHGGNAREFQLMVGAGMPPMEAIKAATASAAELLGDPQDIGTIQPGRYADLVATSQDPLTDITELQRIVFVMKGGTVVKSPF